LEKEGELIEKLNIDLADAEDLKESSEIDQSIFQKKYLKLQSWKLYKRSLRCSDYGERKQKVNCLKEEIERKDLQRKFMLLHRLEINRRYNDIINRKIREFDLRRRQIRTWVCIIKLLRLGRYAINAFYVVLYLR